MAAADHYGDTAKRKKMYMRFYDGLQSRSFSSFSTHSLDHNLGGGDRNALFSCISDQTFLNLNSDELG